MSIQYKKVYQVLQRVAQMRQIQMAPQNPPETAPTPGPSNSLNSKESKTIQNSATINTEECDKTPTTPAKCPADELELRQCRLCSEMYSLPDLYQHYETKHKVCHCMYCDCTLESREELSTHLEIVHKMLPESNQNAGEVCNNNGKEMKLMLCAQCNSTFNSDTEASAHSCKNGISRSVKRVKKTQVHESNCLKEAPSPNINTIAITPNDKESCRPPLRPRNGLCKKCFQPVPPSKLAQHRKECKWTPPPAASNAQQQQYPAPAKKKIRITTVPQSPLLPLPLPSAEYQQCITPPMVKNLTVPLVRLSPSQIQLYSKHNRAPEIQTASAKMLVSKLKKRRTDAAQLAHLPLPLAPPRKPTPTVPIPTMLSPAKKDEIVVPDPLALESNPTKRMTMLISLLADHIKNARNSVAAVSACDEKIQDPVFILTVSRDWNFWEEKHLSWLLQQMLIQSSEKCTYCRQATVIRVDKRQLVIHLFIHHQFNIQKISKIDNSSQNAEGVLNPTVRDDELAVTSNEFEMFMLEGIFHSHSTSTDMLFRFDRGDIEIGQVLCDCLICGQRIPTQHFFTHWRKAHRGVPMTCAMCSGQFLFCGSLLSHHCFGTRQPFTCSQSFPEDFSNRTILLRYQCEFCDTQLSNFFNYMVHIRKFHNTCELCLGTFGNQKLLESHYRGHKLNHFCHKCGITYFEKPNFMNHLFWKHGNESTTCHACLEKKWPFIYHFCLPPENFKCRTCGLQFKKSTSLVVHSRLHTNVKLRKCSQCSDEFISKKLLDKHIDLNHKEEEPSDKVTGTEETVLEDDAKTSQTQSKDETVEEVIEAVTVAEEEGLVLGKEDVKVGPTVESHIVEKSEQEATTSPVNPVALELNLSENESEDEDIEFVEENVNKVNMQTDKNNNCNFDTPPLPAPTLPTPDESMMPESLDSLDIANKSDESAISDLVTGKESGAMSPLLPHFLDDQDHEHGTAILNTSHTNDEEHIVECLSMDHDYCLMPPQVPHETAATNSTISTVPAPLPFKQTPVVELVKPQVTSSKQKDCAANTRKRRLSSSSSSSGSSCGSDCSCSSCSGHTCGSSCSCSSSEFEDEVQQMPKDQRKVPILKIALKKIQQGKSGVSKVNGQFLLKRKVGRPLKSQGGTPKPKHRAPKCIEQMFHFKNEEDAYIAESDLETDLSDSEEVYDKQQQEQVIGVLPVPAAFEEVWNQSNETFLLQIVKGVKNLEELLPKPKPSVQVNPTRARGKGRRKRKTLVQAKQTDNVASF